MQFWLFIVLTGEIWFAARCKVLQDFNRPTAIYRYITTYYCEVEEMFLILAQEIQTIIAIYLIYWLKQSYKSFFFQVSEEIKQNEGRDISSVFKCLIHLTFTLTLVYDILPCCVFFVLWLLDCTWLMEAWGKLSGHSSGNIWILTGWLCSLVCSLCFGPSMRRPAKIHKYNTKTQWL